MNRNDGINLKDIKALMKWFDESESDYFSLSQGDFQMKLKKNSSSAVFSSPSPSLFSLSPSENPQSNVPSASSKREDSDEPVLGVEIKSPLVGVFYAAKEPGAEPFVREGDHVEKGQILCILESMKMMNEIKSPAKGRIRKVQVRNEMLVEYGQTLFILEEYA